MSEEHQTQGEDGGSLEIYEHGYQTEKRVTTRGDQGEGTKPTRSESSPHSPHLACLPGGLVVAVPEPWSTVDHLWTPLRPPQGPMSAGGPRTRTNPAPGAASGRPKGCSGALKAQPKIT